MVRIQIEALRILRCLLLLGIVDRDIFRLVSATQVALLSLPI